jgi:hypothetical protein
MHASRRCSSARRGRQGACCEQRATIDEREEEASAGKDDEVAADKQMEARAMFSGGCCR